MNLIKLKAPSGVKRILRELKVQTPKILGKDLFGIYVYGSLTYDAFSPRSSDVDVIVVLNKEFSKGQLGAIRDLYSNLRKINKWGRDLEISFVSRKKIFTPHKVYQSRQKRIVLIDSSDAFNPITWMNIRQSGVVLYGPSPKKWISEISRVRLNNALRRELWYVKRAVAKKRRQKMWEQVYYILTLSRVLFTWNHYALPSKRTAGEWALQNIDAGLRGGLMRALKLLHVRTDKAGTKYFANFLQDLIKYTESKVK